MEKDSEWFTKILKNTDTGKVGVKNMEFSESYKKVRYIEVKIKGTGGINVF